jgi:hypothetical protein
MTGRHWGPSRWAFLTFGLLCLIAAAYPGWESVIPGPLLTFCLAAIFVTIAIAASDELLLRIRRIVWDRKWPR